MMKFKKKKVCLSRLVVTGPLSHYFYIFLDRAVPPGSKFGSVRRLVLDRIIFGPLYLLIMLYVRSIFEVSVRVIA